MVAGSLFPHHVHPRAKTVEDAVHLADGHRDPVLNGVGGERDLVERALHHAIHPRSLSLGAVGYVFHQPADLFRLGYAGW